MAGYIGTITTSEAQNFSSYLNQKSGSYKNGSQLQKN